MTTDFQEVTKAENSHFSLTTPLPSASAMPTRPSASTAVGLGKTICKKDLKHLQSLSSSAPRKTAFTLCPATTIPTAATCAAN